MVNNKPKTTVLYFAAAGAVVALLLAAIGHALDSADPAVPLDHQVLYNWCTLLLSPCIFLMRFRDPDGAIVPGASFVIAVALLNALWYALLRLGYVALRHGLQAPVAASNLGATFPAVVHNEPSATISRRASPFERLADRYEHRLSSERVDSKAGQSDPEPSLASRE